MADYGTTPFFTEIVIEVSWVYSVMPIKRNELKVVAS